MVNLRFRQYDPMLGRFIGRDTFGGVASAPQSGNRHSYAANNPFRYTDPSGHFAQAMKDDPGMATSMALQVVPIVGDLYSLAIGLAGWDPIAGTILEDWERGASMFAAAPFVPPIAGAVKSVGRGARGAFNAANFLFDFTILKKQAALGLGGVFGLLSRIGGSVADAARLGKAADASVGARAGDGLGTGSRRTETVFRVEGPGNERILLRNDGQVELVGSPRNPLFLNFGQEGRARAFLAKRIEQGHTRDVIKSFEVRAELLPSLRSKAVPERLARQYPEAPIRVDIAFPDQFGLRPAQFPELIRSIIQGTGRTL